MVVVLVVVVLVVVVVVVLVVAVVVAVAVVLVVVVMMVMDPGKLEALPRRSWAARSGSREGQGTSFWVAGSSRHFPLGRGNQRGKLQALPRDHGKLQALSLGWSEAPGTSSGRGARGAVPGIV